MPGPVDYVVWVLSFAAELYLVTYLVVSKDFVRYFPLTLYMFLAAVDTAWQYFVIQKYGWSSVEFRYSYYYTESLLTVLLYFTIIQLYQHIFREMRIGRHIRAVAALLLGGTACFSYLVIHQNVGHLTGRFVVELGQNLYFVGLVLTYLLWGAVLKLRETRLRLIQLILALGIYFGAISAAYAFRYIFPSLQTSFLRFIPPVMGTFLPLAWAYTFKRIPEEAVAATAPLAIRLK
jgi:hypothetical protein